MDQESNKAKLPTKAVSVTVYVNNQAVRFTQRLVTGSIIKAAAIEQGVPIKQDYNLFEEITDDKNRKIADNAEIKLLEDIHFLAKKKKIVILVNEQPVKILSRYASGAKIKTLAIKQGVIIQQNFVLQEELPNGTSRIIGDADKVHLHEHMKFTAIAPDDNS